MSSIASCREAGAQGQGWVYLQGPSGGHTSFSLYATYLTLNRVGLTQFTSPERSWSRYSCPTDVELRLRARLGLELGLGLRLGPTHS